MVGLMPLPILRAELERPCAGNVLWPEATGVCRRHRAHLVVGLQDKPDLIKGHLGGGTGEPSLLWISSHKFMHEGAPLVAAQGLKE